MKFPLTMAAIALAALMPPADQAGMFGDRQVAVGTRGASVPGEVDQVDVSVVREFDRGGPVGAGRDADAMHQHEIGAGLFGHLAAEAVDDQRGVAVADAARVIFDRADIASLVHDLIARAVAAGRHDISLVPAAATRLVAGGGLAGARFSATWRPASRNSW